MLESPIEERLARLTPGYRTPDGSMEQDPAYVAEVELRCRGRRKPGYDRPAPNTFSNADKEIAFRKPNDLALASGHAEIVTDRLAQTQAAGSAEDRHVLRIHRVRIHGNSSAS